MLNDVTTLLRLVLLPLLAAAIAFGQSQPTAPESADSGTSNDLFVMFGSDFVRPGLAPKANYNIGLGHTFKFLKKDPFGDEITFGYTYENAGSHGFLHTDFGSHTESLGLMKNFGIPGFYDGESLGAIIHFNDHHSIWIQETFNKIVSIPWYTTTSIGYTRSW
jgi:hypothetical protein